MVHGLRHDLGLPVMTACILFPRCIASALHLGSIPTFSVLVYGVVVGLTEVQPARYLILRTHDSHRGATC